MFSTCSELTPRAPIPDGRMAQFMQPWSWLRLMCVIYEKDVSVVLLTLISSSIVKCQSLTIKNGIFLSQQ